MADNVNHPTHYIQHKYECIEFIEKMTNPLLANAFKYVWRCEDKNKLDEDLEKAIWYLERFKKVGIVAELHHEVRCEMSAMLKENDMNKYKVSILHAIVYLNSFHIDLLVDSIIKQIKERKWLNC